jgi:hypothetical protein
MKRTQTYDRRYRPCWEREAEYLVGAQVVIATPCAYCGEHAEHEEHLVPYSFIANRNTANSPQDNWWTWILPSCAQCNAIAYNQVFPSAFAKRAYIRERLKGKYSDAFVQQEWSEDEMEDLGPSLRQYVTAMQAINETARQRVAYSGPMPRSVGSSVLQDAVRVHYESTEGAIDGRVPSSSGKSEAAGNVRMVGPHHP